MVEHESTTTPVTPPAVVGGLGLQSFTMIVWLGCLVIGGLGLEIPYRLFQLAKPQKPPVIVERIQVELTQDASPPVVGPPKLEQPQEEPAPPEPARAPPPPPPNTPTLAPAPELSALAIPSPAVAFVVPVETPPAPPVQTPTTVPSVAASSTTSKVETAPRTTAAPAGPSRRLAFGVGEGKQPAPDYPRESIRAGQEGRVVIKFTVDEDGRVTSAEVSEGCDYPALNRSAVRAVRERWRFAPGPIRSYIVPISFQLEGQ